MLGAHTHTHTGTHTHRRTQARTHTYTHTHTPTPLACPASCAPGTALVTISDSESSLGEEKVWGDALVVSSAAMYAAYTIMMRRMLPGEEADQLVATFFGYVGLFTTVALAPLVAILLGSGVISLATIPRDVYFIILLEGTPGRGGRGGGGDPYSSESCVL